jgi:exopolysaccharide biosynthesis protein
MIRISGHIMKTGLHVIVLVALVGCVQDLNVDDSVAAAPSAGEQSELAYFHDTPPGRSIHVVDVDLCEPDIEIVTTGPNDGVRTVSSFAARTGAVVAINGGHTWGGVPKVSAHDGAYFGDPDAGDIGQAVFGDGLAGFIHQYDAYVAQPNHSEVLSGLLTLVHDGVAAHDTLPHGEYTCSVQHPRTLLGLSADKRHLLLVVVDGRAPAAGRRGMTCAEAADYMVSLGAHWALNLDGGGSSEMIVDGDIVNRPSDGNERPVGSHLAVVRRPGARGHCIDAPVAPPPPLPPAPPAQADGCGGLDVNEALLPGQTMSSCNGRYALAHQGDGNVVLYGADGGARWSTQTHGTSTSSFVMQGDGNLVLYGTAGQALWHSSTSGAPGATLGVQDDGNLVIYGPFGALWASGTDEPRPTSPPPAPPVAPPPSEPPPPPPSASCGVLTVDGVLAPDTWVASCDGRFSLVHQGDGNVVVYNELGVALWSTGTNGTATNALVMQNDGNLVLYTQGGAPLWDASTDGHAGATLRVQDDGNVVVYGAAGNALWSTGTGGH